MPSKQQLKGEKGMVEAVDPYLLLNAASRLFGKGTADLDAAEWQQAVELAGKESLLQQRILESAEAEGIEPAEDELAAARAGIEAGYESHAAFLEDLISNGMNESTLSMALAEKLRVEAVMQKVADAVQVSDADVQAFYQANTAKFEHPELREARHILITINTQFPENRRKAVRARLKKIAQQLADKPEDFEKLAMKHSECPTALEGGNLGKLPQGKLYAELDRMLFAMREGEMSGIIESPMGMHLLRCERIHPDGTAPLEEAADSIREHLLQARRSSAQKQWIKGLFAS